MLVGGAALSARFTRTKIAPNYGGLVAYANDAMNGLELANQIVDPERREQLATQLAGETARMLKAVAARPGAEAGMVEDRPAVARTSRFRAHPTCACISSATTTSTKSSATSIR